MDSLKKKLEALTPTEVKVLYYLTKEERPVTIEELVKKTKMSRPQLWRILRKLLDYDLVIYVTAGFLKGNAELAARLKLDRNSIEQMHGKTRLYISRVTLEELCNDPKISMWIRYLEQEGGG